MTNEQLILLYNNGNTTAIDQLIEQNTGIVYKLANKFYTERTASIDIEDLQQEGFLGLMTAINKYDINNPKKAKFITYAVQWIYQKMQRFISQKNTNDECSLNIPIGEEEDNELMDTIKDDNDCYQAIEDRLYRQQLRKDLEFAMNQRLTLQEKEILKLKYGWNNQQTMSNNEIADVFDTTRNHICTIENRSYGKMRRTPTIRKYAEEIYEERCNSSRIDVNTATNMMYFKDKYLAS